MNDSKISVRYARAIFESALEKGILDKVREDMESIQEVAVTPEFQSLLHNPVMNEMQKSAVVKKVFNDRINPLTLNLLLLVFKNAREQFISAIARNFIDLYKKHMGIKSATIISAAPIDATHSKKIEKAINQVLDATVELKTAEKTDLIGGFILRVEDQQYDASVSTSLKKIKKQLLNK